MAPRGHFAGPFAARNGTNSQKYSTQSLYGKCTRALSFENGAQGTRSFFVDESVVVRKSDVAMVLKCAQQRWFPAHLGSEEQELALPETSGYLLTTGMRQ